MSELFHCLALLCNYLQSYWMPVQVQCICLEVSREQNSRSTHLHEKCAK